jgi:hypothetical protein
MVGKKFEAFREWFTPRKRFWTGLTLIFTSVVGPLFYPSFNGYWGFILGPGLLLFCSTLNLDAHDKR